MKYACSILLIAFGINAFAQQKFELSELGCATKTTLQEIERVYTFVQMAPAFKTTNGTDTIPLSIHIVGNDNGVGYYKLDNLFNVICQLNQRYAPAGFYFYIKFPVHYINNSSYYIHDYSSGFQMMSQNNVGGTANVYFVQDPSGACGYYTSSGDAVAISKSCANSGSTTLTHELGHYFGLPHTFYGWEYGTPSNPEKVTRGPGANCSSAGDGFCDTWADYQASRWPCPYNGNKLDQNGELYHPDSSIYMCYSYDVCMTRFSAQQINEMQFNLHTYRTNLLSTPHTPYSSLDTPKIIYPTDSLYTNFQKISWHKVPGAEYYHVKVYPTAQPVFTWAEVLTADTTTQVNLNIPDGTPVTIYVAPLMGSNVCRLKAKMQDVIFTSSHTTLNIFNYSDEQNIQIVNPVADDNIHVQFQQMQKGIYSFQLFNLNGQKLFENTTTISSNSSSVNFATQALPEGIYFMHILYGADTWVKKLVVIH